MMWNFFDYTKTCREYFGKFEVSTAAPFDPNGQYFVACHPHGTLIFQRCFWRSPLTTDLFKRSFRMLGASVLFRIPVVREMSLFFGSVDASRRNCEHLLQNKVSIVLYPGGVDEMPRADHDAVHLRTRTGFIRLAVKHGVPVLPTFCFGELEAVSAFAPLPSSLSGWLRRKFRMSTTAFVGRWMLPMPRRVPFYLCFGKPIDVRRCGADDDEALNAEVQRVHQLYKSELKGLYEANKDRCGYAGRGLIFDCEALPERKKQE